jgi:hypothetical protein
MKLSIITDIVHFKLDVAAIPRPQLDNIRQRLEGTKVQPNVLKLRLVRSHYSRVQEI